MSRIVSRPFTIAVATVLAAMMVLNAGCGGATPAPATVAPKPAEAAQPAATATPAPPTPTPTPDPLALRRIEQGKQVYQKAGCTACHAIKDVGLQGDVGPALDDSYGLAFAAVKDPTYKGKAKTAEEYLREAILDPAKHLIKDCPTGPCQPGVMPTNYGAQLRPEELDTLVLYLATLRQ